MPTFLDFQCVQKSMLVPMTWKAGRIIYIYIFFLNLFWGNYLFFYNLFRGAEYFSVFRGDIILGET